LAAPFVGVYGIGFLSLLLSAYAYEYLKETKLAALIFLGVCLSLPMLLKNKEVSSTEITVNLLQGNIKQDEKFNIARQDALEWYLSEIKNNKADITVLPETAIPFIKEDMPSEFWDQLTLMTQDKAIIIGIPTRDKDKGYGNSAIGLGFKQELQYNKYHLVPFGEFMPPFFQWFLRLMNMPLGNFERGALHQPTWNWQGQRLAPHICYEDLFGEELAAQLVPSDNTLVAGQDVTPTVLVNVSNIAWFGDTIAIDQHLNIARMRTLELQRPMLRATNTGATVIIDHQGRVQAQIPRYTRAELTGTFEGRYGLTPYARWAGRWGLTPLWALCLLVCFWITRGHASGRT
jgi:apolipoprotein N-acyltransferase